MAEPGTRMLDSEASPDERSLAAWLGEDGYARWNAIAGFIETSYPGVFSPDWIYGGKKHGWGLRYKKSKSFCTLIPEHNRLMVQIVFGSDERAKVEAQLDRLISHVREDYVQATTYLDGKWLLIHVDGDNVITDIQNLLTIKRKPKPETA